MKNLFFILLCAMMVSWPVNAAAERVVGDIDGDGRAGIADVTMLIDRLLSNAETESAMTCCWHPRHLRAKT